MVKGTALSASMLSLHHETMGIVFRVRANIYVDDSILQVHSLKL